jgi:hypothetical protein
MGKLRTRGRFLQASVDLKGFGGAVLGEFKGMTKDVGDVVHLSKLSAESQRCEKTPLFAPFIHKMHLNNQSSR